MTEPANPCAPRVLSTQLGRVLIIAAAALTFKVCAQDLPRPAAQALRAAGIPASAVSAWVQEVGASRPTLAVRAETPRNPGSVMKLVTTFAALELLSPAYRWKTEAYLDGEDLVLRGRGDPKLNYESFWMLLRNLRGRGLRELRGDVVLDRSYFGAAQYSPFDSDTYVNSKREKSISANRSSRNSGTTIANSTRAWARPRLFTGPPSLIGLAR